MSARRAKDERERAPGAGAAPGLEPAAHGLGEGARDRDTEARPAVASGALAPVGGEDLPELVLPDPRPLVDHREPDLAADRLGPDDDRRALGREPDRVVDDVPERALGAPAIAEDAEVPARELDVEPDLALVRDRLHELRRLGEERRDVVGPHV